LRQKSGVSQGQSPLAPDAERETLSVPVPSNQRRYLMY
jgi:hypothetical protein